MNSLLSVAEYDNLARTKVSRDHWIPGYRERVPHSSAQVSPWSARRISWISIAELDLDYLHRHLFKPRGYPFPPDMDPDPVLSDQDWIPRLVSFQQITALYAQEPWLILKQLVKPVSFQLVGWFLDLAKVYQEFVDQNAQALWESNHMLALLPDQRRGDPDLARYVRQRKNRRSHSGPRWKIVLQFLLQGMIDGHCDLDILLDPFFLHFPRVIERRIWYPGYGRRGGNIPNLATALSMLDSAEPWRNQYRDSVDRHPGSSIPRLRGKFVAKSLVNFWDEDR